MNLIQNINWNGRSYSLETRVSNNHQAVEDIQEYDTHNNNSVTDQAKRVEYMIDSIS